MIVFALFVVAECVAAALFLPSAVGKAALTRRSAQQTGGEETAAAKKATPTKEGAPAEIEVELGQFSVTSYQPISDTTIRIDLHLFGTIGREDQEAFQAAWQENQHRLRDQVIVTLRSAGQEDLTDAGLGLIKRQILEKTNGTFGRPFLRSAVFSEFSFIEQ
ncbi:MAG: hypothetical protein ACOX1P_12535 [Thermoguttaceae bacterium]